MELLQQETPIRGTTTRPAAGRRGWRRWLDRGARSGWVAVALLLVLLFVLMGGTLLSRAWPILSHTPLLDLLGSIVWQPMRGQFGLAPFLVGSAVVTLVSMAVAVPLALLSALYLAEYTSGRARLLIKPVIDLLAGIPPVVYGLWGVLVIVPFVRESLAPWLDSRLGDSIPWLANRNPSGYSLAAAGLVLSVMVFPLIVSITEEVLRSVPRDLREAVAALGATRWEVTSMVLRGPHARAC